MGFKQQTRVLSEARKNIRRLQEAGEADGDYNHKLYQAICDALNAAGLNATHREFDKYQGVYIQVKGLRLWANDISVSGERTDNVQKYRYRSAYLEAPDGERYSASPGDYFMLNPTAQFSEDDTVLVLVKMDGSEDVIENPTKADLPKEGEVAPGTFSMKPGSSVFVVSLTDDDGVEIADVTVSEDYQTVDVSELVDLIKAKKEARRSPLREDKEYVLWGRPAGSDDALDEKVLLSKGSSMEDVERVKQVASKDGWHSFRVQTLDLSEPWDAQKAFAGTVRGGKGLTESSVKEGKKRFNVKYGVGKAKYVINFHDGVKTHKDGSDFFDIRIFRNQKDFEDAQKELKAQGYLQESSHRGRKNGERRKKGLTESKFNELQAKIEQGNKETGSQFRLGGAYGNYELWVTLPDGGETRLEAGSYRDVYNAWVKYRFVEKYRFPMTESKSPEDEYFDLLCELADATGYEIEGGGAGVPYIYVPLNDAEGRVLIFGSADGPLGWNLMDETMGDVLESGNMDKDIADVSLGEKVAFVRRIVSQLTRPQLPPEVEKAYRSYMRAANPSRSSVNKSTTPGEEKAKQDRINRLRMRYEKLLADWKNKKTESAKDIVSRFKGSLTESVDASVDQDAVRELQLFIDNDGRLHNSQYIPIIKNLSAKKARNVYDHALSQKLWMYLVEAGAKKYAQEYGGSDSVWHEMFPKNVRLAVAKELADEFQTNWDNGEYKEYVPKKYQAKKESNNLPAESSHKVKSPEEWKQYYLGAPDSMKNDLLTYYANRKRAWNAKTISLTKDEKLDLVNFMKGVAAVGVSEQDFEAARTIEESTKNRND